MTAGVAEFFRCVGMGTQRCLRKICKDEGDTVDNSRWNGIKNCGWLSSFIISIRPKQRQKHADIVLP
eukprot:scaffold1032_cov129-Skeletonema_dohrnii-CCMP3373.AAC.7